jgi:hypothetical protein
MIQIPIRADGKAGILEANCLASKGNGVILEAIGLTEGQIKIEMSVYKDSWHTLSDDAGEALIITPSENKIVELENAPYSIRALYEGSQNTDEIELILRTQ